MIVVDTSVWINKFRGIDTAGVRKLSEIDDGATILVGDVILLELLQGARSEAQAGKIERSMRAFAFGQMLDRRLAVHAARNHRTLRRARITIRRLSTSSSARSASSAATHCCTTTAISMLWPSTSACASPEPATSQPVRRFAVTSISTFISGLLSWQTIMVAAGRISPKASPRIGKTTSTKSRSVM